MFETPTRNTELFRGLNKHKKAEKLLALYTEAKQLNDKLNELPKSQQHDPKLRRSLRSRIKNDNTIHAKPEETYEVWPTVENLNVALDQFDPNKRKMNEKESGGKKIKLSRSNLNIETPIDTPSVSGNDDSSDDDDDAEDQALYETPWSKAQFLIRSQGLEILPNINPISISHSKLEDTDHTTISISHSKLEDTDHTTIFTNQVNFTTYHISLLSKLLHLNVLRQNWKLAYRIFGLLIRCKKVNIRGIWPLGLEILIRLREEHELEHNPLFEDYAGIDMKELGPSTSLKLHTLDKDQYSSLIFRDEKFLEWLSSYFIIQFSQSYKKCTVAPAWTSGSRTHAPMYITSLVWQMIFRNDLKRASNKLEELMLEPPYNNEGIFYYLAALVKQLEVSKVLGSLDEEKGLSRDDKHQMSKNVSFIEKNLEKAKVLGFEYPETMINVEINILKRKLASI
ncbi:hypothetical protein BABINDRAFT_30730 [Babjeviella inositovora NRRL Y-12698]|uniref:RNA polymerase I-specific transcription initiation factor RRN11 n=1 Tax=Babjeviella inositovora NRRL Y-12698 TaxID=984486 RepID=A0A1E3QZR5_9ASCO|nr:uncharacterized protein BABINDRAFT_30730 [Babjeviella inositovora NRRL Y-12698]ODQ83111.1 hypothetical protein BABINDRAFT_30730 [Babjeviella inositovora NRRL Y-12698]